MVGKVGIRPNEFGYLTPYETSLIFNSWLDQQTTLQRNEWDRTRWQTTYLIHIHQKEIHRKDPQKMFPFPWDEKTKTGSNTIPSTRERFEELKKKWA